MSLTDSVRKILRGINRDETYATDEGWWETDEGAEFGAKKLSELVTLVSEAERQLAEKDADIEQLKNQLLCTYTHPFPGEGYTCGKCGFSRAVAPVKIGEWNKVSIHGNYAAGLAEVTVTTKEESDEQQDKPIKAWSESCPASPTKKFYPPGC